MRKLSIVAAAIGLAASALPAAAQQSPTLAPPAKLETQTPVAPSTAGAVLTRADAEAWLDGFMPYALQRGDVAGAVVVVVKDGQVLLQKGYGYSDVAKRAPVDPERTLFRPGSVSKLLTWTAVMQLVEQGRLDLDRDVNAYLDFKIPDGPGGPVTLRHILTHTAGFEEQAKSIMGTDPKGVEPLGAFLKRWTPERIYPAGSTPAYSNYATALAGYIVERASGMSFDDYVDRNVLGRLGMTHSSFRQPLPARLKPLMSKGYALASEPAKPYEMVGPAPAGSLAATGADMARFMIAHLNDGAYGSAQILKPETARLMHGTPLTVVPPLNRMLLGFYETNVNGRRVIAHGGDTQWFHSYLHLYLDDGVGLFVSVNSAGRDGAASAIRSALFEQFSDRYLPGPAPDGQVDAKTAAAHAAMIAGLYDNSRRSASNLLASTNLIGQVEVVANADGTIATPGLQNLAGQPRKWREIAPFVWREIGGEQRLAAVVDNGRVVRFSFDEVSPFMVFEPTPWWQSSAWLLPLFLAGLGALALTALQWPVAALVRRRYAAKLALGPQELRAYRLMRGAALAVVATVLGWAATMGAALSDFTLLGPGLDPVFWLLQFLALVVFVGAAVIALWHAWVVWRAKRTWFSRLWSILLALATLVVLWVGVAFHLIDFGVNY